MPVKRGDTTKDGKRQGYYQSDKKGKRYTYPPGNEVLRKLAKEKAIRDIAR